MLFFRTIKSPQFAIVALYIFKPLLVQLRLLIISLPLPNNILPIVAVRGERVLLIAKSIRPNLLEISIDHIIKLDMRVVDSL
jgi:hypothetical protein